MLIDSLEWLDGSVSVSELEARFSSEASAAGGDQVSSFREFILYLYEKGVLVRKD
jgi:hypothetical protein